MHEQSYEGWYTDPYGVHEARWLSDGRPTKLVRDGTVEAYDEPPTGPPVQVPTAIEPAPTATGGRDLIRADDAQNDPAYDTEEASLAAFDIAAQTGPGQIVTLPIDVSYPKRRGK